MKLISPEYSKLNMGCGPDIRKGYVNVDIIKFPGVDYSFDFDKSPWPFKSGSFDEIILYNVLEHLKDLVMPMNELWRISKPGAIIKIKVPYFSHPDAIADPTHKRYFTYKTFDFFIKGKLKNYYDLSNDSANFRILRKRMVFSHNRLLRIFNFLPNIWPMFYERFLSHILPSQSMDIVLKVIKS